MDNLAVDFNQIGWLTYTAIASFMDNCIHIAKLDTSVAFLCETVIANCLHG